MNPKNLSLLTRFQWRPVAVALMFCVIYGTGVKASASTGSQQNHSTSAKFATKDEGPMLEIITTNYVVRIEKKGFRFGLYTSNGSVIAGPHPVSGIQFGTTGDVDLNRKAAELAGMTSGKVFDVETSVLHKVTEESLEFRVSNSAGDNAMVRIKPGLNRLRFSIKPEKKGVYAILARTAGVTPAFGLADHGGLGRADVDVTGFASDYFGARTAPGFYNPEGRVISNFVICPQRGFAVVNVEPRKKVVRVLPEENVQGSSAVEEMSSLYYFVGSPETIYRELKEVRQEEGYPFMPPKYELFGVGWEAFGALGWTTSAATVEKNISTYLQLGYPLSWMVIGSGFWPSTRPELWGTTSFGMWNAERYPDPKAFIKSFKDRGFTVLLGLRIAFKQGNPYAIEAERKNFLIADKEGRPINFQDAGKGATYLLDFENSRAVDWYVRMCDKWLASGADGFKEDLMFFLDRLERDDKVDAVNGALMRKGVQLMGRNMYFGSPTDLHRFNDLNFPETQDRGPINGLALAFSGFPFVYPDIVGGTDLWKHRKKHSDEVIGKYLMRYAEYASVNPAMAFGFGPWTLNDPRVIEVTREAARLHDRLHPYIYSHALKSAETGFPYTMTPLPVAFPDDPGVYGMANNKRRGYQWLLGESLLATPVYGDDYAEAVTRDVYLPKGRWVDYDTHQIFDGPLTLTNYSMPIGKTPLFVGGKGVVVEKEWDRLFAHVYPVQKKTSFEFRHRHGGVSRVDVDVDAWESPLLQVMDVTDQVVVPSRKRGVALEFPIEKGHQYRVQSIPMPAPVILEKSVPTTDLPK